MKKTLDKSIQREFSSSMARFVSIVVLIALGIFVLIGLKVTGHDMRLTGNNFYQSHRMADAQVSGNLSFNKHDERVISKLPHVKEVEFSTYRDAMIKNTNKSIRISSLNKRISINKVVNGRLPQRANEIAINANNKSHYKIGTYIHFTNNKGANKVNGLKVTNYKIVGFITNSDYIKNNNLGMTSAGTGQLSTFGVVTKSAFANYQPTVAEIKYNNVSGTAYNQNYENQTFKNVTRAQNKINRLAKERTNGIKQVALNKVHAKQLEINKSEKRLNQKQQALKNQKKQLAAQMSMMTVAQQKTAKLKLNNANQKLVQARTKLTNAKQKIAKTISKINKSGSVTYQIQDRNDYNPGYNEYGQDAQKVDVLSNTFPLIFFAVALLVSSITMSRMAEQKRIQLGTMRALGYTKFDTMKVFLIYGILAGLLGTGIGVWFGTKFLPYRIFKAYAANFSIPNFQMPYSITWIIISLIISLLCATLPAVYVAGKSLKELPAPLMLPKKTKRASRILLERIPFIWKHFSFNYKVTFRNLFRYKNRMIMTIIGIVGCTALLITGFGIRDSLNGVLKDQYQNVIHYDVVSLHNPLASKKARTDYYKAVDDTKGVRSKTNMFFDSLYTKPTGYSNQSVSLMVPKDVNHFDRFITLRNPTTGNKLKFNNNGAIITQKLARVTNAKVGSKITFKTDDGTKYRVRVSGITKMYVQHYVYMTPKYYKRVFHKSAQNNAVMLKLRDRSNANLNRVSLRLNRQKAAVSSIESNQAKTMVHNYLHGLNNLIAIITLSASALAFVVLFTLTNINVSERERELSTIEVLGFYPREVVMYVYRETFILTIVGILLGFIGGDLLHSFIMQTLPPDNTEVPLGLLWTNFATSGGITIVFSIVVMVIMAIKISRINMLGALKSVD